MNTNRVKISLEELCSFTRLYTQCINPETQQTNTRKSVCLWIALIFNSAPFRDLASSFWVTLSQPFPLNIHPQPSLVMSLIAEALGPRCEVLRLIGWNTTLVDVETR